jgi:translation initiation factor 5
MIKGKYPNQLVEYMQSLNGSILEGMTALFEALFKGVGEGFSKEVDKKKIYLSKTFQNEDTYRLLQNAVDAFLAFASMPVQIQSRRLLWSLKFYIRRCCVPLI